MNLLETVNFFIRIVEKNGRKWALCPFHKEKTESFLINENYFFCFGCKISGNKNFFVRKILNIKNNIISYNNDLKKYSEIRKINFNIFLKFGLFFYKNRFTTTKTISGRLFIPLRNHLGKKIGLAFRNINNNFKNKYCFSNKNKFEKSKYVYGLYECEKYILKKKYLIIVEGFFDLYRLYSLDVKNVVSILGNNINKYVLDLFLSYKIPIFIFFDSDQKKNFSYIRFIKNNFSSINKNVGLIKLLFIDSGDPDTFFIKKKKEDFLKILKKSVNIEEYILRNNELYKKFKFYILKIFYKYKKFVSKESFVTLKKDFCFKKKKILKKIIKNEKKSNYFSFEKELFSFIKRNLIYKKKIFNIFKKNFFFFKIRKNFFSKKKKKDKYNFILENFIKKNLIFRMNFYIKNCWFFKKYKKKTLDLFNKIKNENI
ncbi:CHC2 zinc finger domain-containing protein [Candidatus Vidania fulgoroideorum]